VAIDESMRPSAKRKQIDINEKVAQLNAMVVDVRDSYLLLRFCENIKIFQERRSKMFCEMICLPSYSQNFIYRTYDVSLFRYLYNTLIEVE